MSAPEDDPRDDAPPSREEWAAALAAVTAERDRLLGDLSESDLNALLGRWDLTAPALQRKIVAAFVARAEAGRAFKEWVHGWLDAQGVPADPNPARTAATGCRVSVRLDWLMRRERAVRDAQAAGRRCPTCASPSPELHPAVQHEGEVQPCADPWHAPPSGGPGFTPAGSPPTVPDGEGFTPLPPMTDGRVPCPRCGERMDDVTVGRGPCREWECPKCRRRWDEWEPARKAVRP